METLAVANIRVSCTRDIRPHNLVNVQSREGVRLFEGLFNGHREFYGREIVNWDLACPGNAACLEDERTSIHLGFLTSGPERPFFSTNLVSSETFSYFQDRSSYFYKFLKERKFPIISLHLGMAVEKPVLISNHKNMALFPERLGQVLPRKTVFSRILSSLSSFEKGVRQAGWDGKLLFETLDYEKNEFGSAYEHVTDPLFISNMLHCTSYGLLLDVAHLMCAAGNLGFQSPLEYAENIMREHMGRLREIHLTVPKENGQWSDSHRGIAECLSAPEIIPFFSTLEMLIKSKKQDQPIIINFESPLPTVHLDTVAVVSFLQQVLN